MTKQTNATSDHRRESGVAMLVTMLVLVLMGWIGIAAMDTATRDRQVAGFQNRSRNAFYAAEAGAAQGRALVAGVGARTDTPVLAQTNLGDGAMYNNETQLPQFYGDPAFAPNFIRYTADGKVSGGMNLQTGKPKFVDTLWQINVVGQSPNALGFGGGSTSRVEVMETKILASGY
ncbi:MAG: hypothetical protein QNK05_05170 [Myxococcota bacterium]|nr:hypothetical protein [Myxococcota bacterium]